MGDKGCDYSQGREFENPRGRCHTALPSVIFEREREKDGKMGCN